MTLFTEEAPANSVPAAAVRQKELVLFLVIRCKVLVDALNSWFNTFLVEYSRG